MIQQLELENFTVFKEAALKFSPGLNVVIGEDGTGKSHLLKLIYALACISQNAGEQASRRTKAWLGKATAEKLIHTYRPDSLGRLVRRTPGRQRTQVRFLVADPNTRGSSPSWFGFSFSTNSKTEVVIEQVPDQWETEAPIFLPTREIISVFPGFAALYLKHHLEFDETFYDLCLALESPLLRGPRLKETREMIVALEQTLRGQVVAENRRFYLRIPGRGNLEMSLVAEGMRKIAMLSFLIKNGSLSSRNQLFWDEPEANLNPKLIRLVARSILDLCNNGIQIFVATHSLFLLKEFDILLAQPAHAKVKRRYFALAPGEDAVESTQGDSSDDIEPVVMLDEELTQSDRFMEMENS
ncbi:MAG: AAA family ATPase [Magnetococcales bacterium]|nr:AAA family ATPase [Magnetococcales bacterium]MBF0156715.1 AAA family ATPase [Magnetococcales bacterium]